MPLLVALLFLALAAAPADAPTATASAQRATPAAAGRGAQEGAATLRFVTFNAYHGGFGSGWTGDASHIDERLAIAADQLVALTPDVIALQEASAGRRRGDIAAKLAVTLGFHHVRASASRWAVPLPLVNDLAAWILDFDEGPAILSRFPIVASETYELPRCRAYLDPRVVLRAEVATFDKIGLKTKLEGLPSAVYSETKFTKKQMAHCDNFQWPWPRTDTSRCSPPTPRAWTARSSGPRTWSARGAARCPRS